MADTVTRSSGPVKHVYVRGTDLNAHLNNAADEVPKLNYAVNVCSGNTLVSAPPTRHQLRWRFDVDPQPERVDPPDGLGEDAGDEALEELARAERRQFYDRWCDAAREQNRQLGILNFLQHQEANRRGDRLAADIG